jgi:hypothetical protein
MMAHLYTKIYEFAASAGALEGYVYRREELDMDALPKWVDNLVSAYHHLPSDVRQEFQSSCNGTLGRAIRSLNVVLDEKDEIIVKLRSVVADDLPKSPDDFEKKKWFEK